MNHVRYVMRNMGVWVTMGFSLFSLSHKKWIFDTPQVAQLCVYIEVKISVRLLIRKQQRTTDNKQKQAIPSVHCR